MGDLTTYFCLLGIKQQWVLCLCDVSPFLLELEEQEGSDWGKGAIYTPLPGISYK